MAVAILLSGGSGSRAGFSIPKQYMVVAGRPVISYCIDTLVKSNAIEAFKIVADESWHNFILSEIEKENAAHKFTGFALPGENRQLSILNGLNACKGIKGDNLVMIHDAARPCLTVNNIDEYIEAAAGHDGVIPVLPMKDTVYISENGCEVSGLIDRKTVFSGQAPEFFLFDKYLEANLSLGDNILNINGSTEPAIMAGMDIAMVPGNEDNIKITTKGDFERFRRLMGEA